MVFLKKCHTLFYRLLATARIIGHCCITRYYFIDTDLYRCALSSSEPRRLAIILSFQPIISKTCFVFIIVGLSETESSEISDNEDSGGPETAVPITRTR